MKLRSLFLILAVALALPACVSTVTTAPDGTVTKVSRVDTEALNPWADVAREVVVTRAPQVRAEK